MSKAQPVENGSKELVIEGPSLYPKQYLAIMDPARHCFIEASTKAGKTVGCIVWQFHQCCLKAGHHWWVAPVYQQARIAYERAKEYIPDSIIAATNETGLYIKLINGSTWTFRSGEKPDNLYGEDVHSVVIDEASRCKEAVWTAIRSTLTATRGRSRVIGNVKGRKNWFYRLARRAQQGARGYAYHKLNAYDAVQGGVLAAQEIEDARADMPEHVFNELYLALATEDGSNPFGVPSILKCFARYAEQKPAVCYGIDLAKSVDWTVIIGLDENGNESEFHRFQKPWNETIDAIKRIVGNVDALVDSTGVGDPILDMLTADGATNFEGFKFSSQSKQQLMEGLAADINKGFAIRSEDIKNELEEFEFAYVNRRVTYSAPVGLHDDAVCALALARMIYRDTSRGLNAWW